MLGLFVDIRSFSAVCSYKQGCIFSHTWKGVSGIHPSSGVATSKGTHMLVILMTVAKGVSIVVLASYAPLGMFTGALWLPEECV